MKNFDSRTYSINDFLEWYKNEQLELSPKFQRRYVWTENARSYLMDTIVRGKPIPKIFIRQKLNALTKVSIREVVDGQQRLRTILTYLNDGFKIKVGHNPDHGGRFFSQLDEDTQVAILNYEIAVDLLVNMPDSEVLDVFGRLNSYAVVLNQQERLNASHFGPFKLLADQIGHEHSDYWAKNKILTDAQILRMGDVALAADLLISMIEGIKDKKQVKSYYELYERHFDHDPVRLEQDFRRVHSTLQSIFDEEMPNTAFSRAPIFYSLFMAIYTLRIGLPDETGVRYKVWNFAWVRQVLESINELFLMEDRRNLSEDQLQFRTDSRLATTDAKVRIRRTQYIINLLKAVG